MTTKVKVFLGGTLAFLLVIGGEFAWIHHKNNEELPVAKNPNGTLKVDDDDLVFIRKEHPVTIKDERALIGKTIWVSAAAQMDYYHYANHQADYAHPVSTLPGAEALMVKDVFEQKPPSGRAVMRISAGQRHVLLAFTLPGSSDPKAVYAVPVGHYDYDGYTFFTDTIFFYDDPRVLYKYWGPVMWAHIDKHEPAMGMSENQAMLSLGQVMVPHGDKIGDRSVTYDNNAQPITMTFESGKAVRIQKEKQ